jgi:small-conductance mechanosensitive channel
MSGSVRSVGLLLLLFLSLALPAPCARAADAPAPATAAPVVVDGVTLFHVRGVSAFPAAERAQTIAEHIRTVAAEPAVATSTLHVVPAERSSDIVMGDRPIMSVFDADAELEGLHRADLARAYAQRIAKAVEAYRRDRSPHSLLVGAGASLVATIALGVALWIFFRLWRRLSLTLERRYLRRVQSLEFQGIPVIHAEQVHTLARATSRIVRAVALLALADVYLSFVLTRFPWTRPAAARLLGYVLAPLGTMGHALLAFLPNLVFLVILVVVTRYVLTLVSLVAAGVERGTIRLGGFQPEWAGPTYRIVRIAVIGFAAVVAYPYIPGSDSAAFKGMSIFFGVLFSLGASSVVGNLLAGYSLIYRRTFRVGDRVKIGDVVGDVTEMRLQVTHLRTIKNEDVIVPNSAILTTQVVNYSSYAAGDGLILHTTVGIGYETPWRQVEAMLLLAARRTPGFRATPPPFVLQTSLGDFAISYELNVYCGDAHAMASLYSALHRSIQDVFNEYGVQIMTPAYEADPHVPKVVPKDQWYQAPARPPDEPSSNPTG